MKTFMFLITALLLSGCASTNMSNSSDEITAKGLADGGYLVTALTYTTAGDEMSIFNAIRLSFRNIETGEEGIIRVIPGNMFADQDEDIKEKDKIGHSIALALLPGKYEIFSYRLDVNLGVSDRWWYNPKDFSIPFEIVQGEATCIGELQTKGIWGKNALGFRDLFGGYFELINTTDRDIQLVSKKVPELSNSCTYKPLVIPQDLESVFVVKTGHSE